MILYRKGDATTPIETGRVMITHVNNTAGAWGSGFVIPLGNKFPNVKIGYSDWFHNGYYKSGNNIVKFELGEIQPLSTSVKNLYVCNMIAQKSCGNTFGLRPFRPDSFEECLLRLNHKLLKYGFDYMVGPRMGAGLSGESWQVVSGIIEKVITIPVVIYDRVEDNWPGTVYED